MSDKTTEQPVKVVPKIMIVDRDRVACQMLENSIRDAGHEPLVEPTRENALKIHEEEGYNIIFHDCSPQPEARPFIIGLRRGSNRKKRYTYVAITSRDKSREDIIHSGGNDHVAKPIDTEQIKKTIENGTRLLTYYHDLQASAEDNSIPCQGAMLGKSATTQIFLTAVDRADRYGEKAYLLEMTLDNIDDIANRLGAEAAEQAIELFITKMKRTRRQSDMLGRMGRLRFALIMQRTVSEREPIDATERLCQSIEEFLREPDMIDFGLSLNLQTMGIPTGEIVATAHAKTYLEEEAPLSQSGNS